MVKDATGVIAGIAIVLGVIALIAGWFVLAVWIAVWNVTDMQANGVSFWPMFWMFIAAMMVVGPSYIRSSN